MTTLLTIKDGAIVLPARLRKGLGGAHMRLSEYDGHIVIEGPLVTNKLSPTELRAVWASTAGSISKKTGRALLALSKKTRNEWATRLREQDKLWKKLRS